MAGCVGPYIISYLILFGVDSYCVDSLRVESICLLSITSVCFGVCFVASLRSSLAGVLRSFA